jgi:deoxyribodipyrimidine photo-lyase
MATPPTPIRPERLLMLNQNTAPAPGPVLYWMSRDQRVADNWALLYAQQESRIRGVPLAVVFCLVPDFLGATLRHYAFMLKGLEETEQTLRTLSIGFLLLRGDPAHEIPACAARLKAGLVVTDFDPLRLKTAWRSALAAALPVPLVEVDAHNIVPARHVSLKQEFGAYTLRPKHRRLCPGFITPMPAITRHPHAWPHASAPVDWAKIRKALRVDPSVGEVSWLTPGAVAGLSLMRRFIREKLDAYPEANRDPTRDGLSNLSPYLHFGQLSAQRFALEVGASSAAQPAKDAFLEELIVRRELADNFCLYNPCYDAPSGFPAWAGKTLSEHAHDPRAYLYSRERLEGADTHDDLWNAAQMQMVATGKMHGYMRMYWAKKILEWTASPAEALQTVIELNDRYELDGRDPSGYAGAAWSIGGTHDRAWGERPVFGKIRYMNYNGCKSKFNVATYVERIRAEGHLTTNEAKRSNP